MKMVDALYLDLFPLHPNILNLYTDLNTDFFQIPVFPSHSLGLPVGLECGPMLVTSAQNNLTSLHTNNVLLQHADESVRQRMLGNTPQEN